MTHTIIHYKNKNEQQPDYLTWDVIVKYPNSEALT